MVESKDVVGRACTVEERVLARNRERLFADVDSLAKDRAECACGEERDESEGELHVCVVEMKRF
jgi:hypothetical protein